MSILESNVTISTPAELVAVLREVHAYVAQGRLRQLRTANRLVPETSAKDLSEAGPWPDYIDMSFEDNAGYRYRLEVETYHGTGGSWSRF
jgi:hypothetical protein